MADQTVREPLQERSRRSLEAIYAAAIDALAEGGWGAVTVGEIERRSGVTRGTFYLRFPTRDALIDYVHERLLTEVRELQDHTFGPLMTGGALPLDEACLLAVRAMADVFGCVGRVMVHGERLDRPPSGHEALAGLSRNVTAVLRRGLDGTPGSTAAVEFVVELAFAAFVARQRPVPPFPGHRQSAEDEFTERLATALAAYLRTAIA